jgi:hypothetical protein
VVHLLSLSVLHRVEKYKPCSKRVTIQKFQLIQAAENAKKRRLRGNEPFMELHQWLLQVTEKP